MYILSASELNSIVQVGCVSMAGHSCSSRCRRKELHFTQLHWQLHGYLTEKLIELLSADEKVRTWSFQSENRAYIPRRTGPFLSQVTQELFEDDPIFGGQYPMRYLEMMALTRSRIYQSVQPYSLRPRFDILYLAFVTFISNHAVHRPRIASRPTTHLRVHRRNPHGITWRISNPCGIPRVRAIFLCSRVSS